MAKIESKSKSEWVALGKMTVSEFSQREVKKYRVDALASEFDPERIGRPVLSLRDGRYYIMDGQHRIAALKQWNGPGWEQVQIECQVFSGLDEAQEADIFLQLNDVLSVNAYDKFSKAVAAGREVETAVKKCVEQQGLVINYAAGANGLSCVSTLVKIYRRSNGQTLGRALRIIRDAYGDLGMEAVVVDGIAHLCQRYNGVLDEQKAKARLGEARGGVKGLVNRATDIKLRTGNSKALCVAAAAVDIINQGHGGKKLPSWWKVSDDVAIAK